MVVTVNRSTYYLPDSNYQKMVDQVLWYLLLQGSPTVSQTVIISKWLTLPTITAIEGLTRSYSMYYE
jgi:hypothetical protein